MYKAFPLLLAALTAGCGNHDDKVGSATRDFALTGFDRVALAGPDDVEITAGPAFRVVAQGDAEVLERLRLDVADGQLRVGREKDRSIVPLLGHKGRAIVRVTLPMLRGADLAGAGRLTVDTVDVPAFEGSIAGAGNYRIAALKARSAHFNLSGAGNLSLGGGEAARLDLTVSGAGNVDAEKLTATDLSVSLAGVGNVSARATGTVTGTMSGVGGISVSGTDRCDIRKSGIGRVSCSA